jgi:hypothetical protein
MKLLLLTLSLCIFSCDKQNNDEFVKLKLIFPKLTTASYHFKYDNCNKSIIKDIAKINMIDSSIYETYNEMEIRSDSLLVCPLFKKEYEKYFAFAYSVTSNNQFEGNYFIGITTISKNGQIISKQSFNIGDDPEGIFYGNLFLYGDTLQYWIQKQGYVDVMDSLYHVNIDNSVENYIFNKDGIIKKKI